MNDNRDICCYFVTKHSWKGKYKRIFSVGNRGITTYSPTTLEVTNQWNYNEFSGILPCFKSQGNTEFTINIKKGARKTDQMKFSSDHRADILTESLRFSHNFAEIFAQNKSFNAFKTHWTESKKQVTLVVTPSCLIQKDPTTNKILANYDYKEINYLSNVSDAPNGFIISNNGFNRLHMFQCEERQQLIEAILKYAGDFIGISLRYRKEPITIDQFMNEKFGKFSADECITSLAEFTVYKTSERHREPVRRILCLSEVAIIERDPSSYSICTLKPLDEIFAIIRSEVDPQEFSIEYMRGPVRVYTSSDRDSLLASLLDGVRASGNQDVCIKMRPTNRGYRLGPFNAVIDEEVESLHMKFVHENPPTYQMEEVLVRFNVNIPYSGLINAVTQDRLFAENKEKLINNTLVAMRDFEPTQCNADILETEFHVLRRLIASKSGYKAFTQLPKFRETIGRKIVRSLKLEHDGLTYAAIEFLNSLMQPMHSDYDLKQEQLNKASLLSSKKFLEGLMEIFKVHVKNGTGALVIAAMLDFFTYSLCPPFSETTDGEHFDTLLEMVAANGRIFYKLFQHPSLAIIKGAGMIMKAIIEEGTPQLALRMQEFAMSEGALPRHLHTALFTQSIDARMLTMRQLSRSLVGLWCASNPVAIDLLKRIIPAGLFQALFSAELAPKDRDLLNVRDNLSLAIEHTNEVNQTARMQLINKSKKIQRQIMNAQSVRVIEKQLTNVLQHWKQRVGSTGPALSAKSEEKVIVLRRRRQRLKSQENWDLFYYKFNLDHAQPNLIWNFKCREELREAIESETRAFSNDKDLGQGYIIAWNFVEFEVQYNCLSDEIKIGEYYLRLLLESGSDIIEKITRGLTMSGVTEKTESDETEETEKAETKTEDCNGMEVGKSNPFEEIANSGGQEAVSGSEKVLAPGLEIKNAVGFFNDLYHRFLLSSNMKALCLQAMTIVYTKCHEEIGAFNDTKYIMLMLEKCVDRTERDRLLVFIDSLILNRSNVKDILDVNGVRILVDLLTLAHLHTTRAYVPTQTNVIESGDIERDTEKEWYYGNKQGPFSFKEIKQLYADSTITEKTKLWAQGMDGWKTIDKIPQLKWTLLATGTPIMNETSMATLILNILLKMCHFYPSKDADGAIIRPLPKIKRLLSESICLPHIVQLLLTFDPIIVEKVATLLYALIQDNPIISRLYLTGCFYFISMYTGSNILPIGRFLEYTHLKQAFRTDDQDTKKMTNDIVQRSILGHIFPEAMICYLENHGYERFSQIYLGEFDTPEAIWNNEMRRHMIDKIAGHLAEFSPRLRSNTRALYQYCPIPIIAYPQLENELFCNIYYLRHLCNEKRFANWEIKEPVKLLKDCLLNWRFEVEKKPPLMSRDDALEILELKRESPEAPLPDDNKVRRAYFKLAQKYHPDKNPEGREMFEKVNKAYEFICSAAKIKDGPDPNNINLILKAQIILFKRYSDVLMPYKYAGYSMLIKTIKMETADETLFSKTDGLLPNACELVYYTIKCSALNAEELRREAGLEAVNEAFGRCVTMLSQYSKEEEADVSFQVCLFVTQCYSAAAQFVQCRERLFSMPNLVKDVTRCLHFKNLPKLCLTATSTVSAFAPALSLSTALYEAGVLNNLVFYMFNYDFTLEEGGVERSNDSNQQEINNQLAIACIRACARLAGFHNGFDDVDAKLDKMLTSENPDNITSSKHNPIMTSLCALLTPYLAKNIKGEPSEILKLMNSNTQNPSLIWDNTTRAELRAYLENERDYLYKKGECQDEFLGQRFTYSVFEKELVIGDIYARIYNEMPAYNLPDPKKFCIDLLDFLGSHAQYLYSILMNPSHSPTPPSDDLIDITEPSPTKTSQTNLRIVEIGVEALRNVIRHNDGVETQCIGHFKLLFTLLRLGNLSPRLQTLTLEMLIGCTANKDCVSDIASAEVLLNLLLVLHSFKDGQLLALDCLHALSSSPKIVKDMIPSGGILYLLNIFANGSVPQVRQKSAELFAKLLSDKLTGPRIRLILQRFLPPLFMDAMKENSEAAVITYEGVYENPELIWNDESREHVSKAITHMCQRLYSRQSEPSGGSEEKWKILEDLVEAGVKNVKEATSTLYTSSSVNEVVVGGVFIRLFIENPGWVLRKPREFLVELFDLWAEHAVKKSVEGDVLEQLTRALSILFDVQPLLLENVPQMGTLPKALQALSSKNDAIAGFGLQVVTQIVRNDNCLRALAGSEFIRILKEAIARRSDLIGLAAETLSRVFKNQSVVDDFVGQSLQCDMINFLLGLLEKPLTDVESPGSVKALIVEAIKAMLNSMQHLTQVESVLHGSRVWRDFKDQDHGLFIEKLNKPLAIGGSVPSVAGYLTDGKSALTVDSKVPPPPPPENLLD